MKRTTPLVALVAIHVFLTSIPASARVSRLTTQWHARNSPIIGFATGLDIRLRGATSDVECARLAVTRWVRGDPGLSTIETCYTTATHIEMGGGPGRVQPGEEVIFFGAELEGTNLRLVDEYRGLVTPRNFLWTTGTGAPGRTYEDFKEGLLLAVEFVDSTDEHRNRMLPSLAALGNPHVWDLLAWEIPLGGFDRSLLAQELLAQFGVPPSEDATRLLLLHAANKTPDVRGRFLNDLLDLCLAAMQSEDHVLRRTAFGIAKSETAVSRYVAGLRCTPSGGGQNPAWCTRLVYGEEDFGYDPDGPEEERAAGLERWRAWWAENRGKGPYDRSEAVIAAEIELDRTRPQRMAELDRRLGEAIKVGIDTGRIAPLGLDDRQIGVLQLAGWDVTPDGRVVPVGTTDAEASETPDAAGPGADASDATEEEAEAPVEQRPKGCGGCAAAGDGWVGTGMCILAVGAWLAAGRRRGRGQLPRSDGAAGA